MPGKNPTIQVSSSPPSAGTRTYDGTPSTNPTITSPDCGNRDQQSGSPLSTFRFAGSTAHTGLAAHRSDLSAPAPIDLQGLSPTAEEFTPLTSTFAGAQTNARIGAGVGTRPSILVTPFVRGLLQDSDPDDTPSPSPTYSDDSLTFVLQADPGIIGQPARPSRLIHSNIGPKRVESQSPLPVVYGKFTVDERFSRAFVVFGLNPATASERYEFIAKSYRNFASLVNINAKALNQGAFAIQFSDVQDAKQALVLTLTLLFSGEPGVDCAKQTPKDIAFAANIDPDTVTDHQAEYLVHVVDIGGPKSPFKAEALLAECIKCGPVKAFKTHLTDRRAFVSYRVEFNDTRKDPTGLSGILFYGYRICIEPYAPDVIKVAPRQPPLDNPAHMAAVMGYYRPTRSSAILPPGANHNVVDIMKIVLGQDVRTTIMLRNIPNRVDQESLKKLLDQTSKGAYDFMYLRIDFANNCNVGYAFINFVDPLSIVPFAKARSGQKWNLFHSDKVAEISYATIQGRDCLVQKFRNSSVMCERPAFRPKLYKTGPGPDAGQEEPFPLPDNESKLRRSLDNAETVGLYKPYSLNGSTPAQAADTIIPAPKNQAAGGSYTTPAPTRVAFSIKSLVNTSVNIPVVGRSSRIAQDSPSTRLSSPSLYAPREGQAYRERQRRQLSRFDRGTLGAESELAMLSSRFGSLGFTGSESDSTAGPANFLHGFAG